MANKLPVSPQNQNKNQLKLNYLLAVVAVASLLLGVWQIKNAIFSPFVGTRGSENGQTPKNNDDLALQNKDTDSDGLSDYDEINVYKTSIYLKDSDSDGVDDKTEVEKGTDPNCPTGRNCSEVIAPATTTGEPNNTTKTNVTPAEIRDMLKKNGISDSVIAKYDDASLLKMYSEVAGEVATTNQPASNPISGGNTATPNSNPNLTTEQKQKILNLPVADLRKYLLDSGAEADVLQKMDDATLKTLVKQVLGL